MDSFGLLWGKLVESSIWAEPDHVRILFVVMVAKADSDDVVRANEFMLSRWCYKTEDEVMDALNVLSSPDRRSKRKQEFDGRRIEVRPDGWFVINRAKYRREASEMRDRNRRAEAARNKRKLESDGFRKTRKIDPIEKAAMAEFKENGESEEYGRLAALRKNSDSVLEQLEKNGHTVVAMESEPVCADNARTDMTCYKCRRSIEDEVWGTNCSGEPCHAPGKCIENDRTEIPGIEMPITA